jgi:TonB-linked SusC/RagA family outer membrane protein
LAITLVNIQFKGMHLFALCKYPSVLPFGSMAGKPKLCSKNRAIHCVAMGLKVMKITAVILLATCLQAAAAGYGQKVTISEKDAPVEKIFSLIRKQTGFQFLYANQVLAQARKVTIQVKNAELEDVLAATFNGQPFEYHIKDKTIIVRMRVAPASMSAAAGIPQPPVDVRGRVVNENGDPVEGVSVSVKGTSIATSTNSNGEFSLKGVEENGTLVFTSVNIESFETRINKRSFIDVALQTKVSSMKEVVVNKGYYTEKKRFATGNVSSVKARDIEMQPVNNPLLTLQGRVPGIAITQSTGIAGGGIKVRIQGQNSLNSGNDPLYVIDGVPYVSQALPDFSGVGGVLGDNGNTAPDATAGANPLSFINPADIESIEVLKDADATSIYGSRAAAGAILITTKRGKAGQTSVNVNVQNGWGKVANFMDLLNTEQYLEMRREAYSNDGVAVPTRSSNPFASNYDFTVWDQSRYTDWQKVLLGGTAHYFDAQSSVSGGSNNTQFLIGVGYHRETTVFPSDLKDQKYSLHFNVSHASNNKRLQIQLSGNYLIDNNDLVIKDLTENAIKLAPVAPDLYNADGLLNWEPLQDGTSTWLNPLSFLLNKYNRKTNNLLSNLSISYEIAKNLSIKGSFGYTNLGTDEIVVYPNSALPPDRRQNTNRLGLYGTGNINSWIVEPQLQYKTAMRNIKIEALVGSTFLERNSNSKQILGSGYNSDVVIEDINSAASISVYSPTITSVYKYSAIFARLNFNVSDKYILNLTARRDGSSRFGSENLFHNFGAAALAWLFSNEDFISESIPFISYGKLRASIGTTGNDQIGDYRFMSLYTPVSVQTPFQGANGIAPLGLPNPYLQWEETKKIQGGIELGFINDRILLDVNYYHNRSSNQLQPYSLPILTGNNSIQINFPATVDNTGWEFSLNTMNIKGQKFSWSSYINLTLPKNKLKAYQDLEKSSVANTYVIGEPIPISKSYQFDGIDPSTGLFVVLDKNGMGVAGPVNVKDAGVLNITAPSLFGGFENKFKYGGFELDVLFQYVKQQAPNYKLGTQPGRFTSDIYGEVIIANQPSTVLNRWQKQGDEGFFQKFSSSYPIAVRTAYNNARQSTISFSDASFLRLKNASLSWQIPTRWKRSAHLQNARIYVQGQNLLTFTDYVGLDPESATILNLPPLRVITVGVQVGF